MARSPVRRQIRRAYSQDKLARICTLPEYKFGRAFGMQTVKINQKWPHDYYHFKDNGSRVLAVAHLDTVVAPKFRQARFSNTQNGPMITSGALDDRLGAYVILGLLPELGVTCDVLLTVGEESGASTAEFFAPAKDYDWIIEFDRGGTDVVMYQYEDKASRLAVEAAGATMGDGSFSDIAYLEHIGVKAFNWGVGYRGDYHSVRGYAYLNDTFAMVAKYLRFHAQNAGTALPHEPRTWQDDYMGWRDNETRYYFNCDYCGGKKTVDDCTLICEVCKKCLDCGEDELFCQCFIPVPGNRDPEPARVSISDAIRQSVLAEPDDVDDVQDRITAANSMFNQTVDGVHYPINPVNRLDRDMQEARAFAAGVVTGSLLPAIGDAAKTNAAEAERRIAAIVAESDNA